MSASGHGRNITGAFTPLDFENWASLVTLADLAVESPQAMAELRLAIASLAPGWWHAVRAADQATRLRLADNADQADPQPEPLSTRVVFEFATSGLAAWVVEALRKDRRRNGGGFAVIRIGRLEEYTPVQGWRLLPPDPADEGSGT